VLIGQDGRFSFSHVPPGEYRLRFVAFPAVSGGASASWGMRTVGKPAQVSDLTTWFVDLPLSLVRSVADLEVPLQAGSRIRGRVVFDGRSDLPPVDALNTVLMFVYPAQGRELRPSVLGIPAGAVDAQGRFETMGLPPGTYVLDPHAYLDRTFNVATSIQVDGREALEAGIDLGTADVADVVVTLSSRKWDLSGVVRDPAGRPLPGARGIVFPRDRSQWQSVGFDTQRRVLNVAADESAVFRTGGSVAGDYLIAVVTNPTEFWMAPEYLETLVPIATPVRLELGEQQMVELRLR
jgi:hypothetical protein